MNAASVEIGGVLRAEIARRGLSQEDVAVEFKVSQSRISRVLKGEFTARSDLARALCATYLEGSDAPDLEQHAHMEIARQAFDRAVQALRLMWDGSAEHADRLVKMIDAVRRSRTDSEPRDLSV